jgi:hypothetical protein
MSFLPFSKRLFDRRRGYRGASIEANQQFRQSNAKATNLRRQSKRLRMRCAVLG